jgi:hypothetical protein
MPEDKVVAEIKQLKREVVGLKENLKDVLRILGVVYGQPYIQPKKTMLSEQSKGYDEALARLRAQYFEFSEKPSSHSH